MVSINIEELTATERLELIERLWDSLDKMPPVLTTAQSEELDRRLDADDSGDEPGVPWDEVEARLRQRLR